MTAVKEASVINLILAELNDAGTAVWGTAEIQSMLDRTMGELSEYSPYMQISTVTFASTAKELDVSTVTGLIRVDEVEFPVDKDPVQMRNFTMRANGVCHVDIDFRPVAGATAYVYYEAQHDLADASTTNTLNLEEERLLIHLTAARLLMREPLANLHTQAADFKFADLGTVVGNMSTAILASGTSLLEAGTAIGVDDLEAGTVLDAMAINIAAATADLGSARSFVNAVNVGNPEIDYVNFASGELSAAVTKLNEARGLVNEASTIAEWQKQAAAKLAEAGANASQSAVYMNRIRAQIQSVNLTGQYTVIGREKLADVHRRLKKIAKRRVYEDLPRGK